MTKAFKYEGAYYYSCNDLKGTNYEKFDIIEDEKGNMHAMYNPKFEEFVVASLAEKPSLCKQQLRKLYGKAWKPQYMDNHVIKKVRLDKVEKEK